MGCRVFVQHDARHLGFPGARPGAPAGGGAVAPRLASPVNIAMASAHARPLRMARLLTRRSGGAVRQYTPVRHRSSRHASRASRLRRARGSDREHRAVADPVGEVTEARRAAGLAEQDERHEHPDHAAAPLGGVTSTTSAVSAGYRRSRRAREQAANARYGPAGRLRPRASGTRPASSTVAAAWSAIAGMITARRPMLRQAARGGPHAEGGAE